MAVNKLKLNADKTEFFLIGNERQKNKYLFPVEVLGVETNPPKICSESCINFGESFPSAVTYMSSATHALTTSGICSIFVDT